MEILSDREAKRCFQLGLAYLATLIDAVHVARALSELAEVIVVEYLKLADDDAVVKYGRLEGHHRAGRGFGIFGYGSLGDPSSVSRGS